MTTLRRSSRLKRAADNELDEVVAMIEGAASTSKSPKQNSKKAKKIPQQEFEVNALAIPAVSAAIDNAAIGGNAVEDDSEATGNVKNTRKTKESKDTNPAENQSTAVNAPKAKQPKKKKKNNNAAKNVPITMPAPPEPKLTHMPLEILELIIDKLNICGNILTSLCYVTSSHLPFLDIHALTCVNSRFRSFFDDVFLSNLLKKRKVYAAIKAPARDLLLLYLHTCCPEKRDDSYCSGAEACGKCDFERITVTAAKTMYYVNEKDLAGLGYYSSTNPHSRHGPPMRLYLKKAIVRAALKKHGKDLVILQGEKEQAKQIRRDKKETSSERRREELTMALAARGLRVRDDSAISQAYIDGSKARNLGQIVDIMMNMHIIHVHSWASHLKEEAYQQLKENSYGQWDKEDWDEYKSGAEHEAMQLYQQVAERHRVRPYTNAPICVECGQANLREKVWALYCRHASWDED